MKLKEGIFVQEQLPPFGIVLAGGGGAGRWQAGVLVALAQLGILEQAKVVTGTSVGGLNSGLFALYGGTLPKDKIETGIDMGSGGRPPEPYTAAIDVWEGITKNSDIYQGELNLLGKIGAGIGFLTGAESILDNSNLHKLIDNVFRDMTFKEASTLFNMKIIVSALNLNTQKEEFFSSFDQRVANVKVADALKATSAIPGIFKSVPITINGKTNWYVDGGAGANNPFISLSKYNEAFPDNAVKKAIIIFCFPDETIDTWTNEAPQTSDKSFKAYRDALLGTIPAALSAQEQLAEMLIIDKVKNSDWDVMALWPEKAPCDSLDFTKTQILQDGYDYATKGLGWDYKNNSYIDILDFLHR